ncbi:galectin [Elysia marginata]|uniref:Galectin n=1 Tax=Elysia marginata TaxID=1093978 RepID=A0AAV4FPF3_9GAST|nr:galectin [Elysia marginata]
MTAIRFNERSVVSNSFIGYWGGENRYTPHFNFQQGQELNVFCVVNSQRYELYLDRVMFKQFPHRLPIDKISEFSLGGATSKIISFSR